MIASLYYSFTDYDIINLLFGIILPIIRDLFRIFESDSPRLLEIRRSDFLAGSKSP
jgi:hypothetical protein